MLEKMLDTFTFQQILMGWSNKGRWNERDM